ncbi:hypothetical protein [Arthrobacter sp. 92]|uniref:hypothetical protein n=1 Tax=Arthrobacter sp. 92 TaxID=3418175 RepID=UPI003CFF927B
MENGEVRNGWLVLAAPVFVAAGMMLGPRRKPEVDSTICDPVFPRFLIHSFWILLVLAALHFAIGGIPVLSANVETDRFNLGGSGLGGFPSRAVLYAIPAVALLSLSTVRAATKRQTIAIWMLYVLTQLGLGFKGAVLEIIVLAGIGYLIRVARPRFKHMAILIVGLVGAFIYVDVVRSLYATTAGGGPGGLQYIWDRSTTQAIESGYLALWNSPDFSGGLSAFWHDLQTLLMRYAGAANDGDYTFDMLMSSIVTGTPLGAGMFIVPVTVGGTVYLMFSLATPVVIAVLGAIGWTWSWAVAGLRCNPTLFRGTFAAVFIIGLRMFLLNGNGAYLVINLMFVVVLLWICALPSWLISRKRRLGTAIEMDPRTSTTTRPALG